MAIEFECSNCKSVLRVGDETAGKRARCPQCQFLLDIPGGSPDDEVTLPPNSDAHYVDAVKSESTSESSASHQFYIDSVAGQTYGPVTRSQLDEWVAQGRVSANCKIRATGYEGVPATDFYPNLSGAIPIHASSAASPDFSRPADQYGDQTAKGEFKQENPYSSPSAAVNTYASDKFGEAVEADLGSMFQIAWRLFTEHMPLLLGTALTLFVVATLTEMAEEMAGERRMGFIGGGLALALNILQIFLGIGQTIICLKLCRGQQAKYEDLFSGGERFLPVLGYTIIALIALGIGFMLLVVPGILLCLYFWPSYFLVIDRSAPVFESFGEASHFAKKNLLNTFVIAIASVGISLLGIILFCVGYIFAIAYLSVLWCVFYLSITGQVQHLRRYY